VSLRLDVWSCEQALHTHIWPCDKHPFFTLQACEKQQNEATCLEWKGFQNWKKENNIAHTTPLDVSLSLYFSQVLQFQQLPSTLPMPLLLPTK
jgi:hypothetical protein